MSYYHLHSKAPAIRGNVLKNEQMVLLLCEEDTLTTKQLTLVFTVTGHT